MKSQVVSIQVLRGVAAFLVVIAHVIEHPMRSQPNSALITGRFGVEIFFVISGFIIAFVAGNSRFDPGSFAIRRALRIVPLYWFCTAVVFALALVAPSLFKTTVADVGHLLRSLVFIPSPDPSNASDWRPLFKLGWTLNYEMFFYTAMLLLFWCRSSLQRALLLSAGMGALVLASLFVEHRSSVFAFYANLNLLPFISGVWLAELRGRGQFERGGWMFAALCAGAAVALTALLYAQDFRSLILPVGHLIMTAAALMIVVSGLLIERHCRVGHLFGLRSIGDASYSLYMTHMFVIGAAWAVMQRLGITGIAAVAGGIATTLACVVVALLSYRLLEEPFNKLGRYLTRKPSKRAEKPLMPVGYAVRDASRMP